MSGSNYNKMMYAIKAEGKKTTKSSGATMGCLIYPDHFSDNFEPNPHVIKVERYDDHGPEAAIISMEARKHKLVA